MAKAKKIVKASALENKIQAAAESLLVVKNDAETAADVLGKDRKNLLSDNKKLAKKRAVLSKKKKAADARFKKAPDAANKKAAAAISKELATVKKVSDKSKTVASANAEELKAIKVSLKQASVYVAALAKAEKLLNKPKKKSAKKRVVKVKTEA